MERARLYPRSLCRYSPVYERRRAEARTDSYRLLARLRTLRASERRLGVRP